MLRHGLRLLAAVLFLGTLLWWIQAGRNPGWTKNQVAVPRFDEVAEISYMEYEKRFVPGVDLLAASSGIALVLGVLGFLPRRKKT